ncbi:MAG TPA: DUF3352 domain-containing protein, partial [Actinomycetes bacterium]|nr:DUF3352 domain-containing protein [Actinomycetes bacterium]
PPGSPQAGSEPVPAFAPPSGWASSESRDADAEATLPGDELAFGDRPAARRPWALIGVAAGVVLAMLVGGVVFAVGKLSGGGTQPEELVPASAFAFAKLDLDPAAGQKVAVMQFLRHFPDAADALGENDDIREAIFGNAAEDAGLDYAADVEPWLGDRFAVAAIPGAAGEDPDFGIYVQVSDQDKAAGPLAKMFAAGGEPAAVTFRKGYAVVSENQAALDREQTAATEGTLSSASTFKSDMADLGGDEVAAAWVDLEAAVAAVAASAPGGLAGLQAEQQQVLDTFQGRIAVSARFTDDYAEIIGRAVDVDATSGLSRSAEPVGTVMRNLPPSTGVAFAISGAGANIEQTWPNLAEALGQAGGGEPEQIDAMLERLEDRYGLKLPEDLATLLGEQTLFAFDLDTSQSQVPLVGMRAVTDPAAAEDVVREVLSMLEFEFGVDVSALPVHWETAGDSLYITSDPSYAQALQRGGAVADPAFETALPDLDRAQVALWVDVDGIASGLLPSEEADQVAGHVAGVGFTAGYEDSGNATFRVRVVAD